MTEGQTLDRLQLSQVLCVRCYVLEVRCYVLLHTTQAGTHSGTLDRAPLRSGLLAAVGG
jgi:hypothetical protein